MTFYMRACVIPCDVEDLDGDKLDKDEILDIYTKFNNRNNITLRHNGVYLNDVELLESYITDEEEKVALEVVPANSWVVMVKTDNLELNQAILNGEVNGISLTNVIKDTCPLKPNTKYENPNDYDYSDVDVKKCIYPQDLSFVKNPANAYGIHIADDLNKITKQIKVNKMGLVEDLKKLLSNYEEPETEAEAAEVEVIEEAVTEVEAIEETEATEEVEEPATVEKEAETETEEATGEAETEEKPADDIQAQLDDIYKRLEELESKTNVEAPKIVKKEAKKIIEPVSEPVVVKNYFELSGRDPITGMRK